MKFRNKNDRNLDGTKCLLSEPTVQNIILQQNVQQPRVLRRSSRLIKKRNVGALPLLNAPKPRKRRG